MDPENVMLFLEQLRDPVGVTTPGGEWVMLNAAARRLVGHDLPLTSFDSFVPVGEQARLQRFCRLSCDALAADVGPITISVVPASGLEVETIWITATAVPANDQSIHSVYLVFRVGASPNAENNATLIGSTNVPPPADCQQTEEASDDGSATVLSLRETSILRQIIDGHRIQTIAQQLFLSEHTVRNTLKRINQKLGTSSTAELREKYWLHERTLVRNLTAPFETIPEVHQWSQRQVSGTHA
jgi:DNA-binding CsgD family transcriptional regulator